MLLGIVEFEAGILCRDFHGTFGSADVKFRKKVKSGDIYLGKAVKAIKIEWYYQGRSCRENKLRTETKVKR